MTINEGPLRSDEPEDTDTDELYESAHLLEPAGAFDEAEVAYRRVIELRPADSRAHCGLGSVLLAWERTR